MIFYETLIQSSGPTRLHLARFDHFQLSYCSLEIIYAVKDCDPCGALLYVCVSVCLSRFYGLYFTYYGLDFDQTW